MYITKTEQRLIYLRGYLAEAQAMLAECRVNGYESKIAENNVLGMLTRVYHAQEQVKRERWYRHQSTCGARAQLIGA